MTNAPLLPTNDYVFKRIFSENLNVLGSFLKAVLDLPAEEALHIEILNSELRPEHILDKYCILDIKLHTRRGEVIDIEMQVQKQEFIWKRIQYYTARLLSEQVQKGDEYSTLPQVVSILIADFELIPENDRYHHCFYFYDEEARIRFPDSMAIHLLEIPKAWKPDGTFLHEWMQFFRAKNEEDFTMLAKTSPVMAEAWGVIKTLSADESTRMIAEAREKGRMDYISGINSAKREGRQEGLLEGRQEEKFEVAGKLLQKNMSPADIADCTGLSLAEIQRLAR